MRECCPDSLTQRGFFLFRSSYGRLDYFMHNFRLWLYLVCGLTLATISHAQTATVYPVGVNSASINSSGNVVSMQTFRATYAGQPDSYYSRAVTYNKATTGKLGKARAFVKGNALNLGIVAATLAIGYALDEITKDIYSVPGSAGAPLTLSPQLYYATYTKNSVSYNFYSNDPYSSTLKMMNHQGYASTGQMACSNPTTYYGCHGASGGLSFGSRKYTGGTLPAINNTTSFDNSTAPTQATDAQIHDAIFPQPKWQQNGYLGDNLPELLRDPVTGATELTQEVQDVATQVQNQHTQLYNPTATPVTAPTVSPNYTTDTNNPAPSDMPAFCGWASAVCDFMNWFKNDTTTEPTIAPLPQETLTYTAPEWSSGLGSGSCPSPNTISVLGGSFEISYQPFCTLAELLKYLVLALAYITSALIISGVKK